MDCDTSKMYDNCAALSMDPEMVHSSQPPGGPEDAEFLNDESSHSLPNVEYCKIDSTPPAPFCRYSSRSMVSNLQHRHMTDVLAFVLY